MISKTVLRCSPRNLGISKQCRSDLSPPSYLCLLLLPGRERAHLFYLVTSSGLKLAWKQLHPPQHTLHNLIKDTLFRPPDCSWI